jgi:hypothetical protein
VCCAFHCDCGRHFASLEAFDAHRSGPLAARICRDPGTVRKLVAKSEDGRCEICFSQPVLGVTVWQTRRAAEATWNG